MNGEMGLYFRAEDYAAIWRRFLVDVIDLLTVGLICVVLTAVFGGDGSKQLASLVLDNDFLLLFCAFEEIVLHAWIPRSGSQDRRSERPVSERLELDSEDDVHVPGTA